MISGEDPFDPTSARMQAEEMQIIILPPASREIQPRRKNNAADSIPVARPGPRSCVVGGHLSTERRTIAGRQGNGGESSEHRLLSRSYGSRLRSTLWECNTAQ